MGDRRLIDADELQPWSTFEHLIRTLRVRADQPMDLVARLCGEAVHCIAEARDAGVILSRPERTVQTVYATGAAPQRLDQLQQQTGRGPCLTAARKQIVVRMHDIAGDTRWADFCDAARDLGVASMLCVPMFVDEQVLGTLSLYGDRPDAFRDGAEPVARVMATLAAIALAESVQISRMERALENRDLIGQAKGVLMHAHGVRPDEAFEMLRAHSQRTNIKLLDVAGRVVETGTLS